MPVSLPYSRSRWSTRVVYAGGSKAGGRDAAAGHAVLRPHAPGVGTLLPDMLFYDPTRPASFPGNGRTLTDDAGDAFLAVLTKGKVRGTK